MRWGTPQVPARPKAGLVRAPAAVNSRRVRVESIRLSPPHLVGVLASSSELPPCARALPGIPVAGGAVEAGPRDSPGGVESPPRWTGLAPVDGGAAGLLVPTPAEPGELCPCCWGGSIPAGTPARALNDAPGVVPDSAGGASRASPRAGWLAVPRSAVGVDKAFASSGGSPGAAVGGKRLPRPGRDRRGTKETPAKLATTSEK